MNYQQPNASSFLPSASGFPGQGGPFQTGQQLQQADPQQAKEREVLEMLESIERSYTPSSPQYKFSHVFYNIVDRPFERPANFPPQLWQEALLPDPSLMPVILNKAQIENRKVLQNDLIRKINESKSAILKKADALGVKREMLRSKLSVIIRKYRGVSKQYLQGEPNADVYKMAMETISRNKLVITKSKGDVYEWLLKLRERLTELEERVTGSIETHGRKNITSYLSGKL